MKDGAEEVYDFDENMDERIEKWESIVRGVKQHTGSDVGAESAEKKEEFCRRYIDGTWEKVSRGSPIIFKRCLIRKLTPRDCAEADSLTGDTRIDDGPVYPIFLKKGSYFNLYSHFFLALFLNRIIQCIGNERVHSDVFCMGWGFSGKFGWESDKFVREKTWVDEIVLMVIESDAFRALQQPTSLTVGHHLRTIVWLRSPGHAFAVGWDIHRKTADNFDCRLFQFNCLIHDELPWNVMDQLKPHLDKHFSQDFVLIKRIMIHPMEIGVVADFPCLPFMARCTLYLLFLVDLVETAFVQTLAETFPGKIKDERILFERFETMLFDFMERITAGHSEEGTDEFKLLLVPEKFANNKIVNINDIWLELADDPDHSVITRYVFCGFDKGFVEIRPPDSVETSLPSKRLPCPECCPCQARPTTTPSSSSSQLPAIRFCRQLVLDLLGKRTPRCSI